MGHLVKKIAVNGFCSIAVQDLNVTGINSGEQQRQADASASICEHQRKACLLKVIQVLLLKQKGRDK